MSATPNEEIRFLIAQDRLKETFAKFHTARLSPEDTDTLLALEGRYHTLAKSRATGKHSDDQLDLEYNSIRVGLLALSSRILQSEPSLFNTSNRYWMIGVGVLLLLSGLITVSIAHLLKEQQPTYSTQGENGVIIDAGRDVYFQPELQTIQAPEPDTTHLDTTP